MKVGAHSIALGLALALGTGSAMADVREIIADSPDAASSAAYLQLIARGAKAITAFVNSCADKNWPRLHAALTDDAVVEYPLPALGSFFAVDAANIGSYCNTTGAPGHLAALTVFPSVDDSLIILYSVQPAGPHVVRRAHLVQIKIDGDRISHMRDFTARRP